MGKKSTKPCNSEDSCVLKKLCKESERKKFKLAQEKNSASFLAGWFKNYEIY